MISSVSIKVGEGSKCVQLLLPQGQGAAVYFHGEFDAIEGFANRLLAAVAAKRAEPAPEPLPEVAEEVVDVDFGALQTPDTTEYLVVVKTAARVKERRSWTYEKVEAASPQEAADSAVKMAAEWWKLQPRDLTVFSVEKC